MLKLSIPAFILLCLSYSFIACNNEQTEEPGAKIKFDMDALNAQGLQGPPDGLRSLSYEFCVPREEAKMEEVKRIDPSVRFQEGAPGRIGCTGEEVLAIGNTQQTNFKDVLLEIAGLKYVEEIREVHFE